MKNIFLGFIIITLFINCTNQKTNYEDEIKLVQYELNTEFANASTSPLTEESLKIFKALDFFEIDKNYRFEAEFELTPNTPIFEMQTTTQRLPLYRKYGIAQFTLNGEKFELSIYQSQDLMTTIEYEDYLFLPFNDKTNGNLSYGGGRFLDLKLPSEESNTIVIDFNKAYNPYCAYNHKYSCPIPPSENNLSIAIPAGVKAYGDHH
ncbi:MAG: DUF1684 domain-containing protein [Lutibacter sp.]|nr:DUF1684 domain-containing protein [Lutibacter sp.]